MTIDWRILLIVTLIIILAFGWMFVLRADLKAELAAAQATTAALRLANDGFVETAQRQMAAVKILETETALRADKLAAAEKQASKLAARYDALAADIAKRQASGDQCVAASRIIDLYRRQRP